jgi:magnesium transporter
MLADKLEAISTDLEEIQGSLTGVRNIIAKRAISRVLNDLDDVYNELTSTEYHEQQQTLKEQTERMKQRVIAEVIGELERIGDMKQVFLSTTTEFKEIDTLQPGTWINLVNPTQSESMEIASAFDIDIADLRAPLDAEEMSRITIEDEYTLIIVDVPITEERNNRTYYVTIPLGIIITEEAIITTCLEPLPLLDIFINRRLRNFYTFMRSRFIFQILYRNAEIYLTALRSIERKSEQIESQLHKSTRNEELIELMELEKTIVYFKASLKTNERVIKKLTSATSNIKKYLEDEDLLEDTLIETQQAIEMADIYGNVLHSMTETFASIISNNQNNIMKTLALVTIVMSIPTMIFSAYGMNFKDNEIPLNGEPHAFWLIVFIAFAMSVSLTLYLIHKKWF